MGFKICKNDNTSTPKVVKTPKNTDKYPSKSFRGFSSVAIFAIFEWWYFVQLQTEPDPGASVN
jgi:hypothetical protein